MPPAVLDPPPLAAVVRRRWKAASPPRPFLRTVGRRWTPRCGSSCPTLAEPSVGVKRVEKRLEALRDQFPPDAHLGSQLTALHRELGREDGELLERRIA